MREPTMSRRSFLGSALGAALGAALGRTRRAAAEDETFEVVRSEAEWRRTLSPEAYAVLREQDTERPGSSPLDAEKRRGRYLCAGCGLPVFDSRTKFESGTGWPSFWAPIEGAIGTRQEGIAYFIPATEVHCRRCGGHLGHVFADGPKPTRLRYCINGVALRFEPEAATAAGS